MTKPTKWLCTQWGLRSAWSSAQSDQSLCWMPRLIWVFALSMKKHWILSYPLSALRRLWSDWVDAQADLSLCWAHRSFCWFCHEVAQLVWVLLGHQPLKRSILTTWLNYYVLRETEFDESSCCCCFRVILPWYILSFLFVSKEPAVTLK